MKTTRFLLVTAAALALAACGGGGGTILDPDGGGGGQTGAASVQVIASSPQLNSDVTGATTVTLTALVRDSGNAVVTDTPVTFTTSSGSVTVTQPTTDATGQALATLSNGTDPTNRAITVTASVGAISGQVVVNVVGSTLTLTGPTSLALGDSGTFTAVLRDSSGVGISGRTLNVTSANGNTLSAASLTTGVTGQAQFNVTASASGNDTISAQGLGLTATAPLAVSSDAFTLTAPANAAEITLGAVQSVTASWSIGGAPQNGELITFSSTRGTLSSSTATTAGAGTATVTISSTTAGPATISATNDQGTTTSVTVEFVANDAESLTLQASPFTVATGEQSQLTAIVRDINGNLVKNKVVQFILTDTTGGSLSVGSDVTDSQGRAQSVYTGGSVPSANNGVSIRAVVSGDLTGGGQPVEDTVLLTVAQREVDVNIGTGDEIFTPVPSLYSKEWAIIVTDSVGNPVGNTDVQVSMRSVRYHKGSMVLQVDAGGSDLDWVPVYSETDGVLPDGTGCRDEDVDLDGFLSVAEDDPVAGTGFGNGNDVMDAGNRATVVGIPANAPANACGQISYLTGRSQNTEVTTDSGGFARVCVVYTRSDNVWVDVRLAAQLSVFGSEFSSAQEFTLEALADDLNDQNSAPSGQFSPFGQANSCRNPL
ncbi:MAG: hypothetical protein IT486_02250 [Gammaproteobacteria bacterium]|nr:hypothetical protein [Gammaproteobacteria bacterium]